MDPRITATKVIARVIQYHHSLGSELEQIPKDKAPLVKELSYGVMRYLPRLEKLAALLLKKPFREKDSDLYCLLLIGFYQLLYMRIPEHAVLSETVECTKRLKKQWAAGVFNAVLRNFLRQQDNFIKQLDDGEGAEHCHPEWLVSLLQHHYPDMWKEILVQNQARSPMTLRVNSLKITLQEYMALLDANGIVGSPISNITNAIVLEEPCGIDNLPGFFQGLVSVQDASAQLGAEFLKLQPGQRVLDACAAPGGKSTHILELEPDLRELVSMDVDAKRLSLINENISRLQLQATVKQADASDPDSWWDGIVFQRILFDAPCSGVGVIRRHPDIKHLRTAEDIEQLADFQLHCLRNLWPLLENKGYLLYATCSILPDENDKVIEQFVAQTESASVHPLHFPQGNQTEYGLQILPQPQLDGFYYTLIRKNA